MTSTTERQGEPAVSRDGGVGVGPLPQLDDLRVGGSPWRRWVGAGTACGLLVTVGWIMTSSVFLGRQDQVRIVPNSRVIESRQEPLDLLQQAGVPVEMVSLVSRRARA